MDSFAKPRVSTTTDLCYLIASQGNLLGAKIEVKKDGLAVSSDKFAISIVELSKPQADSARSFSIEASAQSIDALGDFRKPFVEHLSGSGFQSIYVLHDDASQHFAEALYPLIFSVENALRAYLTEFMITRIGPEWWRITVTSEQKKKASQRRDNENFFGDGLIDNKPYLIDFRDLGQIVYAQSSGAQTKEEILAKLAEIEETPEAIRALKGELETNYVKFFKETFKDQRFQTLWTDLEKIRHKVAHNSLLSTGDFTTGKQVAEEVLRIIANATEKLPSIEIKPSDLKAIQDTVQSHYQFVPVTEEEFLGELRNAEDFFSGPDAYVGLGHFVKEWLGRKDFDFKASYDLAQELDARGKIEIYKVPGPEYDFTAIRLVAGQTRQVSP